MVRRCLLGTTYNYQKSIQSSNQDLRKRIPKASCSESHKGKILGVQWDDENDTFELDLAGVINAAENSKYTKRNILYMTHTWITLTDCFFDENTTSKNS